VTTAATIDIELKRGDSWDALVRVKGRNGAGDLVYLDLTGVTPKAQIRTTPDATSVLAEITCTITDQVTTTGGVLLRLEDTDTSSLQATTNAKWDLELKWPGVNGDRKTVVEGNVTVTLDTTHA
jgi:hypothetical protein